MLCFILFSSIIAAISALQGMYGLSLVGQMEH